MIQCSDYPVLELLLFLAGTFCTVSATSPCPWGDNVAELQGSCICDYNLAKELSIQCDVVDYEKLVGALHDYASNIVIELLYVNDSSIGVLKNGSLSTLIINNIQLSGCRIKTIEGDAFKGQEKSLKNLNLRNNELTEIPSRSVDVLKNLTVLDLSMNKLTKVLDDAFAKLNLITLKLSDNEVTISPGAFRGLDNTLKNLNLKGTRQKKIPEALRGLKTLAFLDLSYNSLRELPGSAGRLAFDGVDALTGLNLERNFIQNIEPDAFYGIKNTLSSLSLLSNLIPDFPTAAINSVHDLRVLDIGFNLITLLPANAFQGNPSLTLLAIDGNPLPTVPEAALMHLNGTLRGLSFGGPFLNCDCKLRWIIEWIRKYDLQVTSREKPQFCGGPGNLQNRTFYSIKSEELVCPTGVIAVGTVESVDTKDILGAVEEDAVEAVLPPTRASTTSTPRPSTAPPATSTSSSSSSSTTSRPVVSLEKITEAPVASTTTLRTTSRPAMSRTGNVVITRTTISPLKHQQDHSISQQHQPKPPLVLGSPLYKMKSNKGIIVKDALRQDNTVIIYWDTEGPNSIGFKVIYRLFGETSFKSGPPLGNNEREFKIKNVPVQECMIVCVVSSDEIDMSPANVPYNQCKEVRTENSPTSNMDKITIAASAAICATIVVAVVIFVVANRRRARKLHTLHNLDQSKMGGPIAGLPVNCCSGIGPTPSPGGPLSSLATLSAFNNQKDWDQVSAYSTRSIPRPRVFPMERQGSINRAACIDEMRPQSQHFGVGKVSTRSIADGQSQHSFSNNSTRYFGSNPVPTNLISSRPELRQSRQSLAAASDRLSRASFSPNQAHQPHTSARRQRPRSRNRTLEQDPPRPGSRYSLADSTHTLNNYEENNWTDHDMDIYMARNPTTRGGLVPL